MSVKINGKAIDNFKIVYSKKDIYAAKVFAYRLQKLFRQEYACEVDVVDDDVSATDNEIVVGETNRGVKNESETAYSLIEDGGKLFIRSPKSVGYEHIYNAVEAELKDADVDYTNGYSTVKELSEVLTDGSENVLKKTGDMRVMFNNVWIFEKNPPFTKETPELIAPVPFRARQLADVYRDYKPAILGLQEWGDVSCNVVKVREEMKPVVDALGYKELYSNNSAQLALYYDPTAVSLKSFGLHQFTEGDKTRGVLWGVFSDKVTKKSFIVASTHFAWHPDRETANQNRLIHAKQTVQLLSSLYEMYKLPIIIGGDYNCVGNSEPVKVLEEGGLVNVVHLAKNAAAQRSHHPYPHYNSTEDCVPEKVFRPSGTYLEGIDHTFAYHCDSIQFETQAIIKDWFTLASSDHCPVLVDFTFTDKETV